MKTPVEIKPQELFLISYKDKYRQYEEIAAQSTLDYYAKWYEDSEIKVLESLGGQAPDVEVFVTGVNTARCYVQKHYEVRSPAELGDSDFAKLRALNVFMSGQETGTLRKKEVIDGVFVYHLVSTCDSSD